MQFHLKRNILFTNVYNLIIKPIEYFLTTTLLFSNCLPRHFFETANRMAIRYRKFYKGAEILLFENGNVVKTQIIISVANIKTKTSLINIILWIPV